MAPLSRALSDATIGDTYTRLMRLEQGAPTMAEPAKVWALVDVSLRIAYLLGVARETGLGPATAALDGMFERVRRIEKTMLEHR